MYIAGTYYIYIGVNTCRGMIFPRGRTSGQCEKGLVTWTTHCIPVGPVLCKTTLDKYLYNNII